MSTPDGQLPVAGNLQYAAGEYRQRLEESAGQGTCIMCSPFFQADPRYPILQRRRRWFVRERTREYPSPDRGGNYPRRYLLIVSFTHDDHIGSDDWVAIGTLFDWAVREFEIKGGGLCTRFGDQRGGRTIFHPHLHIVEPNLREQEIIGGIPVAVPWDFPVG